MPDLGYTFSSAPSPPQAGMGRGGSSGGSSSGGTIGSGSGTGSSHLGERTQAQAIFISKTDDDLTPATVFIRTNPGRV